VTLWTALVDDAAMFPPGNATAAAAVAAHLEHRSSWYAEVIGPLVVPDTALGTVSRAVPPGQRLAVSVVASGGAGGLLALAGRQVPNLDVVAVETALRDLDDLAGNAERVAAAAAELPADTRVFVELPYAPGWPAAVAPLEAAGLLGKIRTGGTEPEQHPSPEQLAEQLAVLVEADLPFKATAGLHAAIPRMLAGDGGPALAQHGFLTVLMAVDALVDGAEVPEAAALLRRTDRDRVAGAIRGWDATTAGRVRRRIRSFGCCGVSDPVAELVALGLLSPPA
jgi:hypothetical protein